MENYLVWQRLAQPIFYEGVEPDSIKKDERGMTDRMCLGMIRRIVDESVHNHIAKETIVYGTWMTLKETYEYPSADNKVMAIWKFVYLECTDGTPRANNLNEIKGMINLLNKMNTSLSDEIYVVLFFDTLSDSWVALSTALNNTSTNKTLTVKSVTAALLEEEVRQEMHDCHSQMQNL